MEPHQTRVSDVMSHLVVTVERATLLREVHALMAANHVRNICILDDGLLVGVLSDRDVKQALPSIAAGATKAEYDRALDSIQVDEIMVRNGLKTVRSWDPITVAINALVEAGVGFLPVVDSDDRIVGVLTRDNVLRWTRDFLASEAIAALMLEPDLQNTFQSTEDIS